MPADSKPIGRPSSFTEETAAEICRRLREGQTTRQICSDPEMPCQATLFVWLKEKSGFAEQYAQARELQLERWEDDLIDIADARAESSEAVNHARLRVDTRKWIMSKRLPRKYGDRLGIEGTDGLPLQVVVKRFTDEQLEAAETDRLIEHQAVSEAKPLKSLESVRFIDGERVESAPQQDAKPDRSTE